MSILRGADSSRLGSIITCGCRLSGGANLRFCYPVSPCVFSGEAARLLFFEAFEDD